MHMLAFANQLNTKLKQLTHTQTQTVHIQAKKEEEESAHTHAPMGNSFEKFAGSGADAGNNNSYNNNVNSRRGWSRRRRRMAAAAAAAGNTTLTTSAGCDSAMAAGGGVGFAESDGLGAGSNGNSRRWLTHVSSTPNLGGACVCVCV